ncbi:MAG: hypothetical protein AAF791_09005 [Bacteroidota bacterium]
MRVVSLRPIRFSVAVVALGAVWTACTEAPEPVEPSPSPVVQAPETPVSPPDAEPVTEAETDAEGGQAASDQPVTPASVPASADPAPETPNPSEPVRPDPREVASVPLPERPPMRMPAPQTAPAEPEVPARDTHAADAFWRQFQQAIRSRDRAAIASGLADEVRVGDQTFERQSNQVQAVLQAIVEEDTARDAYLAVDALTHGPETSTFSTTAHYTIEGEAYAVEVFGTVAEVTPGDWRLVEVGSR